MTAFNAIQFAPSTKKLSIRNATGNVLYEYDLSVTAVKLEIVRNSTTQQLEVDIETGALNSFATNRMELKLKFSGGNYTSILFDEPAVDRAVEIDGDSIPLCSKDKFTAGFVGSDDIRNNLVSYTNTMILEGEITSFEIDTTSNMLIARYHDDISPNVS
jgi:hypothetical protein